jgi:hypothetical protein
MLTPSPAEFLGKRPYTELANRCSSLNLGFRIRIRIGSGFNQVSGSGSVFGIRIRIQEDKNDPQK